MDYTPAQRAVIEQTGTMFLQGPAGTGKTSAAVARLDALLAAGVSGESILVWLPQRTLGQPYYDLLDRPDLAAGGSVTVSTFGGVVRRMVNLFWPLVDYGFARPDRRPTFLSLETAQYYMARVVGPEIDRHGYFESVTIDRNRLYSQIIDNLNKAAVVGFPYTETAKRLTSAWSGDPAQPKMYDDAQTCAVLFRDYCLEHNLLDYALQVEVFMNTLLPLDAVRDHLMGQHRHIIADNIEEDVPQAHHVLSDLVEEAESALLVYDEDAGYRVFLGADRESAAGLRRVCQEATRFDASFVETAPLAAFRAEMAISLGRKVPAYDPAVDPRDAVIYGNQRYHPEMIDSVADHVRGLVHDQGVPPGEIVVLAPYLSDALRFSLMNRLQAADVSVHSHRPSRALREEPAVTALLTLAQLAHPHWGLRPAAFDVTRMLLESLDGTDLVRAGLLVQHAFRVVEGRATLMPFDTIKPSMQERITYLIGDRYDRLRLWIEAYAEDPLDHFFSRLFGEVLSQTGFGFHDRLDAAAAAANLIDSARKFRQIIDVPPEGKSLAQEYIEMVGQGIIADQYLRGWDVQAENAVLLAPAYTFLMSNRPVSYQFWLNVGGHGWSERLYQPLTNPYVLRQDWPEGVKWGDQQEMEVNQDTLYRMVTGLVRRCRKIIYLGLSELGEQGYEQRGELLMALQRMLRRLAAESP